jgi:hypothetical protein
LTTDRTPIVSVLENSGALIVVDAGGDPSAVGDVRVVTDHGAPVRIARPATLAFTAAVP